MFLDKLISSASPLIWVLSGLMVLSFIVQMIYFLAVYLRILTYKTPKKKKKERIGISVVICARNEAENLAKNLPLFLEQDYPEYEIVVVNDCSTDNTEEVLMNLKVKYARLHYTTIHPDRKFTHGKKLALTVGIKAAKYDHLLLSDADCYPVSDQWIKTLSRHFSKTTELILGVSKFERKKGILNIIIRFEMLFSTMQYMAFAINGNAFRGVGRNLAYKKELFFRHKGFASHLKVIAGDDDLFVSEAATRSNTAIELSKKSFMISEAPSSLGEWLKQKKRRLSTVKFYKTSSKIRFETEYLSRILYYISAIYLLFYDHWFWIALGALFVLSFTKLVVVKLTMKRLDERDLLLPSLLLDPLMPLILGLIRISNLIRPREPKWN
ncbi:glycosyltransferase [Bacteroidota bacterium]